MPAQIKLYLVTFGFLVFAIFLGHAVATEDYETIVAVVLLTLFVLLLIVPGYEFFIALGILTPFTIPLPFVRAFPFFALMLGLCIVKYIFRRSLQKVRDEYVFCFTLPIFLFFGWILVRYLMNPVKPNVGTAIGTGVSGFRGYLNYGISGLFVICLSFFIQTREQVVKLVKWLGIVSLFFTLFFIAVTASGNLMVAQILSAFGLFVGFFDTGMMRFMAMPWFGSLLLILCFLPNLVRLPNVARVFLFLLGIAAVILGGSRASVASAFAIILACALVRRRIVLVSTVILMILGCLLMFRVVGQYYNFKEGVGLLRVLSIVSERVADISDAAGTYKWRQLRWERAMLDIRKRPWVGFGYGGLDNAFTFANRSDYESATIEIDVAAGSIHNGYLSGARAFGVPFCLIFIYILGSRIVIHGIQSARLHQVNPILGDLHAFIFANLISLAFYISVGTDINYHVIWAYLALGLLISRLKPAQSPAIQPTTAAWQREPAALPGMAEIPVPSLPR